MEEVLTEMHRLCWMVGVGAWIRRIYLKPKQLKQNICNGCGQTHLRARLFLNTIPVDQNHLFRMIFQWIFLNRVAQFFHHALYRKQKEQISDLLGGRAFMRVENARLGVKHGILGRESLLNGCECGWKYSKARLTSTIPLTITYLHNLLLIFTIYK